MKRLAVAVLAVASVCADGVARAEGDATRGEKLFEECRACHAPERGVQAIGPNLRGVFGRRAGTLEDFRYSPALRRSGITWTPQTLDGYIADPQKAVPANRMPYAGMPDARDRADLIEYMRQATKGSPDSR
jgi:cytochrome c